MNIKEAKIQIKNAMTAYFTKDDTGEYIVSPERQRPVFLMGAPGIGKTAIMEQVASELGVGLLSYSMTHHTRQSALGLPFIEHKNYKAIECDVSEYTMSEIIAAVYDLMEETGVEEGILFLDEINCVSETLAPVMLQFLQYKVFGRHKLPAGWIVVTAGNPPEYNKSVREFDIATWDRLKRIDVEPDFDIWKEYAFQKGLHGAIITYLEIKKADFYTIEATVTGKQFVTARGWEDLSQMIQLYEMNGIKVDKALIEQYIQKPEIAADFAVYFELFNKYKSDYQVDRILEGKASANVKNRAKKAKFDERIALIGLLLEAVNDYIKETMAFDEIMAENLKALVEYKALLTDTRKTPAEHMQSIIDAKKDRLAKGKASGAISKDSQRVLKRLIGILQAQKELVSDETNKDKAFKSIKSNFDEMIKKSKKNAMVPSEKLGNMLVFLHEVFGEGQEMVIIMTELTANSVSSGYINKYGCQEFFKHNKNLMIWNRHEEIDKEIARLNMY